MSKTKRAVIPVVSHDEAENAMVFFARCSTRLKSIESTMEAEKQKINSRFMEEIAGLKKDQELQFGVLQSYALSNKDKWDGKSLDLLQGRIGFRKGNKKVVKDKKYSWEAITEFVKSKFPKLVRVSYELDKDAILKMGEGKRFDKLKATCFVDVSQDETFYAETKSEELAEAQ
jgi:phage host-nuclease inhibitor protein Gam